LVRAGRALLTETLCDAWATVTGGALSWALRASWFNYINRVADALGVGRD